MPVRLYGLFPISWMYFEKSTNIYLLRRDPLPDRLVWCWINRRLIQPEM